MVLDPRSISINFWRVPDSHRVKYPYDSMSIKNRSFQVSRGISFKDRVQFTQILIWIINRAKLSLPRLSSCRPLQGGPVSLACDYDAKVRLSVGPTKLFGNYFMTICYLFRFRPRIFRIVALQICFITCFGDNVIFLQLLRDIRINTCLYSEGPLLPLILTCRDGFPDYLSRCRERFLANSAGATWLK